MLFFKKDKKYFQNIEEYNRYIIGNFSKDNFVSRMLEEYGELTVDNPRLHCFYRVGDWTVIPCPSEIINLGDFFNLMNWLTQEGEEAFAIAIYKKSNYFSVTEKKNPYGDTVFVKFDKGDVLRWNLPDSSENNKAYSVINGSELEDQNLVKFSCKDFLTYIHADELIEEFKL